MALPAGFSPVPGSSTWTPPKKPGAGSWVNVGSGLSPYGPQAGATPVPGQGAAALSASFQGAQAAAGFSPQSIIDMLHTSRSQGAQAQLQLLSQFAGPLRDAILAASPELAGAAKYLSSLYNDPIPEPLQNMYRENIRSAMASRGFADAGIGAATQEAQYLTALGAHQQTQLLPFAAQFGQGMLGMSGLGPPPQVGFSELAGAYGQSAQAALGYAQLQQGAAQFGAEFDLQQRQFEESLLAGQQQSQFAKEQFYSTQRELDMYYKMIMSGLSGGNSKQRPPPPFQPGNQAFAWNWDKNWTGFAQGPGY